MSGADPRFHAAWHEWLRALATDADAALAAAHVYRDLDTAARDASTLSSLRCPAPPTSGRMRCLAYR